MPVDPYDQYKDLSPTPYLDLLVNLVLVASICGGGLGAIFAVGDIANDNARNGWPLAILVGVIVAVNVVLRVARATVRRHRH